MNPARSLISWGILTTIDWLSITPRTTLQSFSMVITAPFDIKYLFKNHLLKLYTTIIIIYQEPHQLIVMIFRVKDPRRFKLPGPYQFYHELNEVQKSVLGDIALNGPIDAYRASKRLSINVSTTQIAFKKLTERGLLQFKEIVLGETQQNRKIYSLALPGFCLVIPFMLNDDWSECTYQDVRRLISQYPEYFPDLFNNWDQLITDVRMYFEKHEMDDSGKPRYIIPMPDAATHLMCDILYGICDQQFSYRLLSEISPETLSKQLITDLLDHAMNRTPPLQNDPQKVIDGIKDSIHHALTNDNFPGSIAGAEFYAIKRQIPLWKIIKPSLEMEYQRLHQTEMFIKNLLTQ